MSMNEQIVEFGNGADLVGTLVTPENVIPGSPVVITLNAGILHRIGPFRLWVDITRELSSRGFRSLRMDLSGLGESTVRSSDLDGDSRAMLDARDAMDYLQAEMGAEQFVIIGLCSGAYNAHKIAVADERVMGAVFLDGVVWDTTGYLIRKYWKKFTSYRSWRNAIKRRLDRSESSSEAAGEALGEDEFFTTDFPQTQAAEELREMTGRGAQFLFAYTQGYQFFNSRRQFKEMLGFAPNEQVQVDYYPNAEHTFRLTENREMIVDRIGGWFSERFAEVTV